MKKFLDSIKFGFEIIKSVFFKPEKPFEMNGKAQEKWVILYFNWEKFEPFRSCLKIVIRWLFFIAIFWFIFVLVNSCVEQTRQIKNENDEIRKLSGNNNYGSYYLRWTSDEYNYFKSRGMKTFFVNNVNNHQPLVVSQVIIDGCEYLVWRNNHYNGQVLLCHKGNCKSEVHKK